MDHNLSRLLDWFRAAGLGLDPEKGCKLLEYSQELLSWNKRMNLTAFDTFEEIAIKHFLDSAMVFRYLDLKQKNIADIGTGAGFPGLPLKLLEETATVSLIEASKKRCRFLDHIINKLGLAGVKVIQERAEVLGKNGEVREQYQLVTARAVAALNVISEYALPLAAVGGLFLAWKGTKTEEEIKEAEKAIVMLGGEIEKVENYTLPIGDEIRTLVFIRKIRSTPLIYPRRPGIPGKRPLS